MELIKVIAFALSATLLINIVSYHGGFSKSYGDMIRMVTVILLMIFIFSQLGNVLQIVRDLAHKLNMDDTYLNIVLKIVGIAYLGEFGCQLCEDAGEKAIAGKIQWAGKVMIFVVSTPVILALMNLIADLI